jgi:hypothetical protein
MPQPTTDQIHGQNELLYPLGDADTAFQNTLINSGYNPYRANPFVESLKRSAKGLRTSYILRGATGGVPGNAANPNAANDVGADFGQFLKDSLQQGHISNQLKQTYAQLPQAVQAVRNYQNQVAAGGQSATDANPFMGLLSDELSAGNGAGTTNAMTYLRAPLLGADMGRSYASMLNDILSSSQRTLAQDPSTYQPNGGRDIWSYIFGKAGSPF